MVITIPAKNRFGVGYFSFVYLCSRLGVPSVSRLTPSIIKRSEIIFDRLGVGVPLKDQRDLERIRIYRSGAIRGVRYRLGLPVRGQRTQTNARTPKNRRGSGSSGRFSLQNTKAFQMKQGGVAARSPFKDVLGGGGSIGKVGGGVFSSPPLITERGSRKLLNLASGNSTTKRIRIKKKGGYSGDKVSKRWGHKVVAGRRHKRKIGCVNNG